MDNVEISYRATLLTPSRLLHRPEYAEAEGEILWLADGDPNELADREVPHAALLRLVVSRCKLDLVHRGSEPKDAERPDVGQPREVGGVAAGSAGLLQLPQGF